MEREMARIDTIRKAIELGRDKGFVTFDELNELLPSATTAPEDIEAVMAALSDEGIKVIEGE
jgi:RNA polymerase primary sigma factor